MSALCIATLKRTEAKMYEDEVLNRIRQKVSGKDIAKLVRENREGFPEAII
jgi:hypothetical protein